MIDKTISQMYALAWDDLDKDGQPEIISGKEGATTATAERTAGRRMRS